MNLFRKLCAAFLLTLVVLPFTAPFQTCPVDSSHTLNAPATKAAIIVTPSPDDAGSLIGLVVARLRHVPPTSVIHPACGTSATALAVAGFPPRTRAHKGTLSPSDLFVTLRL